MIREDMIHQNPWWKDPSAIELDVHLRELGGSPIKWEPGIVDCLDLTQDKVYTLRGPRQVGKTTLLKRLVRGLLAIPTDAMAVLYLSCDLVSDGRELVELVDGYLELTRRVPSGQRRVLLLDEITTVKGWERGIKHLADTGRLRSSTVVLTGSSSIDLKRSSERLPGRRGEGPTPVNLLMLPARFREYVLTRAPGLARAISSTLAGTEGGRVGALMRLLGGELDSSLSGEVGLHLRDLRTLLGDYMLTGGLMRPTREHVLNGEVHRGTYELYVSTLMGDMNRWGLREEYARQVVRAVVDRMTTPFSLNSVARATEIGSHNTVSSYLEVLEDSFSLVAVHSLDLHEGRASHRRPRKVYFLDPFIYHALRSWALGRVDPFLTSRDLLEDRREVGRVAEMLVAGHLFRLVRDLHPSDLSVHRERLLHWRKKGSDREVDFLVPLEGGWVPVEVKYQRSISDGDARNLRPFKGGVLVSQDVLKESHGHAVVPLELFLYLI